MEYMSKFQKPYQLPSMTKKRSHMVANIQQKPQMPQRSLFCPGTSGEVVQRQIRIVNTTYGVDGKDFETLIHNIQTSLKKSESLSEGDPIYQSMLEEFNTGGVIRYSSYEDLYRSHLRKVHLKKLVETSKSSTVSSTSFPPKKMVSMPSELHESFRPDESSHWKTFGCASPILYDDGNEIARTPKPVISSMLNPKVKTRMVGPGRFVLLGNGSSYKDLVGGGEPSEFAQLASGAMETGEDPGDPEVQKVLRIIYTAEGYGRSMHNIIISYMFFKNFNDIMAKHPGEKLIDLMHRYLPFTHEKGASLSKEHFVLKDEMLLVEGVLRANGVNIEDEKAIEKFLVEQTRHLIKSVDFSLQACKRQKECSISKVPC